MFGIDDALIGGALSLGSSLLGSKSNKSGQTLSPWQSLPKEVQDTYLKTYLPDAQTAYARPFPAMPMTQATDPSKDPFASQALFQLQQIKNAQATNQSMHPQAQAAPAPAAPQAPAGPGYTVMPGGKQIPNMMNQDPMDYIARQRAMMAGA